MNEKFEFLREEKAKEMLAVYERGIQKRNHLTVEKYDNAVILPFKQVGDDTKLGLGGVLNETGGYVELSRNSTYIGGGYEINVIRAIDKTVVYCGYLQQQWGHFLVDTVPRLWYALETKEKIDEYVFTAPLWGECLLKGNYLQFMELLGIADKVVVINEATKYSRVIVPELSYDYKGFINQNEPEKYYSDQYIRTFDYIIEKALDLCGEEQVAYKNIFFTRSRLGWAKERDYGIEAIDSFFKNNGYQILYPEELSLKELIYLMNNCLNFASIQGSASHNILFIKEKINIVIIEREMEINNLQSDIAIMKKLDITYIDANLGILPIAGYSGPFIYMYNNYLEQYARQNELNPPEHQYRTKVYRNRMVIKYLESYRTTLSWIDALKKRLGTTYYVQAGCNECIQELYPDFEFLPYKKWEEYTDKQEIQRRVIKYLIKYNVEYNKWGSNNLWQEFAKTIETSIECGKTEFLIYPFGKNGMLFKQIQQFTSF